MKIIIDRDKCIASGACTTIAPDIFNQSEDGIVALKSEFPPIDLVDAARAAAAACPAGVIVVED